MKLTIVREPFDGRDVMTVGLNREHCAGLHAHPIKMHRAGAAIAGVAANQCAGLAKRFAQILHEQHPRFYIIGVEHTINFYRDSASCHGISPFAHVVVSSLYTPA